MRGVEEWTFVTPFTLRFGLSVRATRTWWLSDLSSLTAELKVLQSQIPPKPWIFSSWISFLSQSRVCVSTCASHGIGFTHTPAYNRTIILWFYIRNDWRESLGSRCVSNGKFCVQERGGGGGSFSLVSRTQRLRPLWKDPAWKCRAKRTLLFTAAHL